MLEVCFLGEQRVRVDGENVTAAVPQRTLGLMAALVLRPGQDQPRSALAAAFWPDSTDEQALTNLRRELHSLRQRVPQFAETLHTTGRLVRWEATDGTSCDVARFLSSSLAAMSAGTQVGSTAFALLADEAVQCYSGDLLPAWTDDWLLEERARLHRTCVELLDALVSSQNTELERRIVYAARRIELEPLEESGYRTLMSLQAKAGDRAAALTTFHRCASMLERELGVPPDPATVRLYDSLVPQETAPDAAPGRAMPSAGRVPLVGRENELATLANRWGQALRRDGGLHLVVGEPGVGKTRLLSEFAMAVERDRGVVAQARCYSSRSRLSMAPIAEWLATKSLRMYQSRLSPAWMTEVERLVPASGQEPGRPEPMVDAYQRHRFFEGLTNAVLVSEQPTLLTLDDIQWCDAETLAWLQFLLRRAVDHPVLVVASGREEEFDDNPDLTALIGSLRIENLLTKSELTPLSPEHAKELAVRAGAEPSGEALFDVTQGLPLYVIESARSGAAQPDALTAVLQGSPRVQGLLDGRLNQLSDQASSVAGLASVIGQEFTPGLLEQASDLPADRVIDALDELWRRRIIVHHRRGTYGFSHELLRDASVRRVPPPRLSSMHRRVAEALEKEAGVDVGVRAGRIADHYELAGLDDRALPFHESAASLAVDRFAHDAAIEHYRSACRLLLVQPESPERDRHELRLRHAISVPLNARYGFASSDLEDELERSLILAERLDDKRLIPLSLVALFSTYIVQGRMAKAYEVSCRALDASDEQDGVIGQAHFAVAGSATMLGRLAEGLEHFAVVPRLTMDQPPSVVGTRPEVHSMAWQAHALWMIGRDSDARDHLKWAIDRAEEVDHAFSLGVALAYATMHAQFDESEEQVIELATQTLELCAKHGFTYYADWARILSGWAMGGQTGLSTIDAGLAGLDSQGAYIRRSYYLTLRADLLLAQGDRDGAQRTLRQAQDIAVKSSDVWWLPEVLRRIAALEPEASARQLLEEAKALAVSQGSTRLAERAASDLAAFGQR